MFRIQNGLKALLLVGGLALVSIPASAQAGGGCHPKFHGGYHPSHCQPSYCQPSYCQPTYCQPYCKPVVHCYPYACQPIVQPCFKPICQPSFHHHGSQPVIIYKW